MKTSLVTLLLCSATISCSKSDDNDSKLGIPVTKSDKSWFARIPGFAKFLYKHEGFVGALEAEGKVHVHRINMSGREWYDIRSFDFKNEVKLSDDNSDYVKVVFSSPTSVANLSACGFKPGFVLHFKDNGSSFLAFVCYSCQDILICDSKFVIISKFGMTIEARDALLKIFKEAFPKDTVVQSINYSG